MTLKSSLNSACSTFLTTSVRLPQINYRPGSLLSLPVKNISNQWIFWHSYRQKVDCVVHFLHLRAVWWPGKHLLVCNCQIFTDFKIFVTGRLSNKPFLVWLLTIPPHLKYVATLPCNLWPLACFLTIMYHKVVWQHMQGLV